MTTPKDTSGQRLRQNKHTERYIKVRQSYYVYRIKEQTRYSGNRPVPWIQMKGHWLRKAGFDIDTPIKIRIADGCLVLTAEQQP